MFLNKINLEKVMEIGRDLELEGQQRKVAKEFAAVDKALRAMVAIGAMEEGEIREEVGLNGEIGFRSEVELNGEILFTIIAVLKEKIDVLARELETITDMLIENQ
jgi:hypothetical protein